MRLIPAIDLRDGRCVRLFKGDFDQETRYPVDPVALAVQYGGLGAKWLHVVDLDGAKRGAPVNLELIRSMQAAAGTAVQYGGGIRTAASLEQALGVAERAVIGSLAVTEPATVAQWFERHGAERLVLALDVRLDDSGTPMVATHGWTRASALTLTDAIERYVPVGLKHVLCTDIDRDGALTGPNVELYRDCAARWPALEFQASGGVRNAADLTALAAAGAAAAVSGKALLEGRLTPEEIRPFLRGA
ncbi:MAG TPA: 1-(5-phosphoribosyl)-5-[(5-phosphoribosylamino)methylideneamino] imidazole-4-carboxamide isomerase [Gammaproteobacteria bacterium]|jgi:phosphoribosylformimino-5-aminoimidazole carboxamide ribotide isomerase|nr:1-(5-phosphoribosyl)-5-[(5-phosphoribosylamino)methylideneamino] imidazole-4-carboxamide isomerase [Gammaproteobacteria bacterium]